MADDLKVLTLERGAVSFSDLAEKQGTTLLKITASSITATPDWQGCLVCFSQACTVTIPSTLPADFSCGWSQDGAGQVTFEAGAGVTLQSVSNANKSSSQFSLGGIAGMAAGTFRLYGDLTS